MSLHHRYWVALFSWIKASGCVHFPSKILNMWSLRCRLLIDFSFRLYQFDDFRYLFCRNCAIRSMMRTPKIPENIRNFVGTVVRWLWSVYANRQEKWYRTFHNVCKRDAVHRNHQSSYYIISDCIVFNFFFFCNNTGSYSRKHLYKKLH